MNLATLEPTLARLKGLQPETRGLEQLVNLYIKGLLVLVSVLHKNATYDTYAYVWEKLTKPCTYTDAQNVYEKVFAFSNLSTERLSLEDQTKLATLALTQTMNWRWLGHAAYQALEAYSQQELSPEERKGVMTAKSWLKASTREVCNLALLRFSISLHSNTLLKDTRPVLEILPTASPAATQLPLSSLVGVKKKRWYSFLFKKIVIRLE